MTRVFAIALVVFGLASCTSTEKTATGGALIGAGAGALINGGKALLLVH